MVKVSGLLTGTRAPGYSCLCSGYDPLCRNQSRPLSSVLVLYTSYIPSPVSSIFVPTSQTEDTPPPPDTSLRPTPDFLHHYPRPKFGRRTAFPKPSEHRRGWGRRVAGCRAPAPSAPSPRPSHTRHVRLGPYPPCSLLSSRSPLGRVCVSVAASVAGLARSLPSSPPPPPPGGIRGSLPGLAQCLRRRFSLPPVASLGRGSPASEPLEASVLVLLRSPRVLEKRPGNGASRFQR